MKNTKQKARHAVTGFSLRRRVSMLYLYDTVHLACCQSQNRYVTSALSLRIFARLSLGTVAFKSLTLLCKNMKDRPLMETVFTYRRRVRDLNPRYQKGTQHFQCCSFGRSDNSTYGQIE